MFPWKRLSSCLFALLLMVWPGLVLAQKGGTGGGSTGGNKGSTSTTVGPGRQPQQGTTGPIFLSGRIAMEDGSPPPSQVAIERVCNGQIRREAFADSKGQFGFQVGQSVGVMQDASDDTPYQMGVPGSSGMNMGMSPTNTIQMGENSLIGCELRASLAGYRSDMVDLSDHRRLDNPDIGTIVLHPYGKVEGTTISVTTLQAPKDAKKAFERGRSAAKKQKWSEAQEQFQKAVDIDPKFAEAWTELGEMYQIQKQPEEARKAYTQAMAADSHYIRPYFGMIELASAENDWKQVASLSDKAIALDSYDYPNLYFFDGVAYFNLGQYQLAEKSARSAQRLDSQHKLPRVDLLLSNILSERQDFSGAADAMRNYLKYLGEGPDAEMAKAQLAKLEQLSSAQKPPAPPAQAK